MEERRGEERRGEERRPHCCRVLSFLVGYLDKAIFHLDFTLSPYLCLSFSLSLSFFLSPYFCLSFSLSLSVPPISTISLSLSYVAIFYHSPSRSLFFSSLSSSFLSCSFFTSFPLFSLTFAFYFSLPFLSVIISRPPLV